MARMWLRRGVGIVVLAIVGVGAWAGANWDTLQTKLAVHRFRTATTDDDRMAKAEALAARQDGPKLLIALCCDADVTLRKPAAATLAKYLESLPESDPHGSALAVEILDALDGGSDADRVTFAPLLPAVVARAAPVHVAKCRSAVSLALKLPGLEARVAAIRCAAQPAVNLRSEVVPLLDADEPEVRRAALFAVGPAIDGEAVLGDEELFRWLHDRDVQVRSICRSALISRGRTDTEISFGERLVHPEASERLKLLMDLRYDDVLTDAEPWLERLSHDTEPAIRAGTARVMMEINAERMLPVPAWVAHLAESDPDPTVRRITRHYRQGTPAGTLDPQIQLVNGP